MLIDYHVHSTYSNDSNYEMEDVIQDAINLGIEELVFTDHVDYGVKVDVGETPLKLYKGKPFMNVDYPNYFKEITHLQKKYKDQITIKKGLEFGMQKHTIDRFQKLFDQYDLDFVLLSVHQIDDLEFWLGDYQKDKTTLEIYNGYYDELYEIIQNYDDYSCLAHFDLIRRYVDDKEDYYEQTKDRIDLILNHLIKHNKGIEINTSHVRYEIDDTTPSRKILERYLELGGTIITIGSDSHKKEHLGFLIEESKAYLKEIGFKYFCTYDKMKPSFHAL